MSTTDVSQPGSRWRSTALLTLLVALAGVLRFYKLGRSSVWIDEGASITIARLPWDELVRTLWQYEANMTTYYLLLRGWMQLGDSEVILRSLSALCGTASVAAIYLLGRRLFDERTGIVAAALLTAHMFHIWLTQEARSYGLVMLLGIVALQPFVEAVREPERRWRWAAYVLLSVLAAYGHLFATLLIPAQWLAVGPRRLRAIGVRRIVVIALAFAFLLAPLALFVLGRDQGQINWIPPLDAGMVLLALFGVNGFNACLLILVLSGLYRALREWSQDDDHAFGLRLVACGFAIPILIVALASLVKPLFFFRYFAICAAPGVILAARVLATARGLPRARRRIVTALGVLTLLSSALITFGYYRQMANWGGDWRSATDYVLAHRQAGDAVAFYVSAGLDSYRYYQDRVPGRAVPRPLPCVVFPPAGALASAHLEPTYDVLRSVSKEHPRLWVVLHQKNTGALPFPFPRPFRLIDQRDFAALVPEMRLTVTLYATR
jgi:mannosyltransferase